jgi:putative transposase
MPARDIEFAQHGFYHVYNRGAGHQVIFREGENYLFVLRQVKKYACELNIAVIAYCLLPNHYHFLLRQDGQQPAGLLPQWVFNSYTKAFNKRYGRSGTLLEGRYKAIPVDKESYLLHLCRYIHVNPMRHGLASQLEEWPYSNYPEWVACAMVLWWIGRSCKPISQPCRSTVNSCGNMLSAKTSCRQSCSLICGRWMPNADR